MPEGPQEIRRDGLPLQGPACGGGCHQCGAGASNREEFVAAALRESGLNIRVIDGNEEARLTLLGVRRGLRVGSRRVLVLDIGGGSTEFVLARGETIEAMVSTGLGASS